MGNVTNMSFASFVGRIPLSKGVRINRLVEFFFRTIVHGYIAEEAASRAVFKRMAPQREIVTDLDAILSPAIPSERGNAGPL